MKCFEKDYSNFYDLLYKNKKYKKEFDLIKKTLKRYTSKPSSLLDLGCGTGKYSNLMTSLNLKVVGVDRSNNMLKIAKQKYSKNKKLTFVKSSIEKINLKKKFDIISALFHILSYQTSSKQIDKFFINSYKHLNKNGILVFDFWYRNGVYNLQSPLRVRIVENKIYRIIRITVSKWYKKINQIFDNHSLLIINKKKNKTFNFQETHKMRYFKLSLIKKLLKKHNFQFLENLDLETGKGISNKSWGALVIAKKNN